MTKPNDHPPNAGIEGSRLGPYLVGARLGSGGAASVHLGVRADGPEGDVVALKVIHEHLAEESEFVNMFLDEARVATKLVHPNIVRTHELGRDGDKLFLAMEYLDGQSLHDVFVRGTRQGARLPVDLVAWIGACVARALHHAHELEDEEGNPLNLVHRDVSPRNVFITYDGGVKLIDFGIAHATGRIAKTAVGQMKGTFSYIAPERALGGICDHRADQFSLAAALWEASTGRRLFRGDDDVSTLRNVLSGSVPDPRSIRDGYPEAFAAILLKALSRDPSARYHDSAALADELDAFRTSCGREDPQVRLASLMLSLFGEKRARKRDAIVGMRAAILTPSEPPRDVSNLAVSSTSSRHTAVTRRGGKRIALGALLTVAIVLVAVLALRSNHGAASRLAEPAFLAPPPLSPSASALPSATAARAVLELVVEPPVAASIEVGGTVYSGPRLRLERERSDQPIEAHVRAPGFQDATVQLVPDQDRTTTIVLAAVDHDTRHDNPSSRSSPAARPRKSSASSAPTLGDLLNRRY